VKIASSGVPISRLRRALAERDPGLAGLRRAVRVTLAATAAFYTARYAFGDPTMATYAAFGAIAMGALSQVEGAPAARTRTYFAAFLTGLVLVTLGTYLAQSTAAATAGMLVVGFAIAFAAVGGGRFSGVGNGLQLFYILPSFPPYAPHTLDSRLAGLALGIGLIALADRLLLPAADPGRYEDVLAPAAAAVADYLEGLGHVVGHGDRDGATPGEDDALARQAAAAEAAVSAARPSQLPAVVRPGSPTHHDLALAHVGEAVRETLACGLRMRQVTLKGPIRVIEPLRQLLDACTTTLRTTASALARGEVPPSPASLLEADATWVASRMRHFEEGHARGPRIEERIAVAGLVSEMAAAAAIATDGVRVAFGGTLSSPSEREGMWYAGRPTWKLWVHRFRVNLDLRSVALRNAVRVGMALAAARLIVPVFDLSHGFWVLLATLTLMRTSAADTRSALPAAFAGTLVGAVAGAGLLLLGGDSPVVYQVALPIVLLLALGLGTLLGPAVAQAGFTLVVTCIFVQLAPATWELTETRLIDVVIGGALGAGIGLLAWPRGAGGQLHREAARCLRSCAVYVRAAAAGLTGVPTSDAARKRARLELSYLESVRLQALHERQGPSLTDVDWQVVLVAAHRLLRGGEALARRYPAPAPLPWSEATALVQARSGGVANTYDSLAAAIGDGAGFTPMSSVTLEGEAIWLRWMLAAGHPDPAVLRVLDTATWLVGLADDVNRAGARMILTSSDAVAEAVTTGGGRPG
jgi:uncharacterized membrane protein YccC